MGGLRIQGPGDGTGSCGPLETIPIMQNSVIFDIEKFQTSGLKPSLHLSAQLLPYVRLDILCWLLLSVMLAADDFSPLQLRGLGIGFQFGSFSHFSLKK